jgi:hypothetical protein
MVGRAAPGTAGSQDNAWEWQPYARAQACAGEGHMSQSSSFRIRQRASFAHRAIGG